MDRAKLIIGLALASALVAACDAPQSQWDDPRTDPGNRAMVALGEAIYGKHCSVCHGARLEGQPNWRERGPTGRMPAPPHDETGHTWHHPDKVLFSITRNGIDPRTVPKGYESDMPPFAGILADEEIWAVLSYIKSRWSSSRVKEARAEMERNAQRR